MVLLILLVCWSLKKISFLSVLPIHLAEVGSKKVNCTLIHSAVSVAEPQETIGGERKSGLIRLILGSENTEINHVPIFLLGHTKPDNQQQLGAV
jgi:hypothetical protein